MNEVEELRAQVARLTEQLTAQAVIPKLPADHAGEQITWHPWEAAPVILCDRAGDLNGCPQCDHSGPSMLAFGLAGPGQPLIRFNANRCPGCQETRVYYRDYSDQYRIGARLVEIAYHPPRTIARAN